MIKNISLEMSLKPFRKTDDVYICSVIEEMFNQWKILVQNADVISVLLWTGDGSEILDWHGDFDEEMEWCHYVGGANNLEDKVHNKKWDPEGTGLHSRCYNYMYNPPVFTFGILKRIVSLIKVVGQRMFPDKKIRVGETFDSGPEFAVSQFKYVRHNEICRGASMGAKSIVCCYATLHGDDMKYAGFPEGIPEGLPFATFFGRQSQLFLEAMGFDYLWLSNGFGFGMETWSTTGAIFDGKDFDVTRFDEVKEKIINFWKTFREECNYRIETRGTNLSVGIDLATDGVPLKDIYSGDFDLLPPPNSPWAALDANFGLEIAGYLSRVCELPGDEYLFRYYVHDPWWANSPWMDRYESLPHDIYLPMSVCRLNEKGEAKLPTHLNILTIDNSFGEMPDFCAHEPSVHINRALRYAPDEASPVVWVYPFDEYHKFRDKKSIKEMFFGDWYICGAINHGLPIGSVISTSNFVQLCKDNTDAMKGRVLVSIVPVAGSEYEKEILGYVKKGGKVIFYGNAGRASEEFLNLTGVEVLPDESYGEMEIEITEETDVIKNGRHSGIIHHRSMSCGGGINTVIAKNTLAMPFVKIGGRIAGTYTDNMVWLDGTCSADYISGHLVTPDDESRYYSGDSLMRKALDILGIKIRFEKEYANSFEPVFTISRHDNAYMFAVCAKDTTVTTKLKMPLGAPLFMGREAKINDDGFAEYYFSKAEFLECRIFVEQEGGVVSCHDINPGSFFRCRRIVVEGLRNATVRFVAPKYCENNIEGMLNSDRTFSVVSEAYDGEYKTDENGTYFEARNITGTMIFAVPFRKLYGSTEEVPGNVIPVLRD